MSREYPRWLCMKHLAFALVALSLAACETSMATVPSGPEPFRVGYAEGCDSGKSAAGHVYARFRKDVARFGSDALYAQGWDNGFSVCKGQYESIARR